jgi:hypothetical protein
MIEAVALGVALFLEVGIKLIAVAVGAATPAGGPPFEGPPASYEVSVATDEEISAAAAELPELLRRAEEARERARQ